MGWEGLVGLRGKWRVGDGGGGGDFSAGLVMGK